MNVHKCGLRRACVVAILGVLVCAAMFVPARICADGTQPPAIKDTVVVGGISVVPVDTTSAMASSSTTDMSVFDLILLVLGVL